MVAVHFRVSLVFVLGLIAVGSARADDECAGWDDNVEGLIFDPVRDQIRQAKKEHLPIADLEQSIAWHTRIAATKGTIGDLSSFELLHFQGVNASTLCQTGNDTHTNITIALDVGLGNLGVSFDNFLLSLPLLPTIGDTKTTVLNSGNAVSVSVSVLTSPSSTCDVELNYFDIHDLGTFSVQFEHGFWNKIYQGLFNFSSRLVKWGLNATGVTKKLEDRISSNVFKLAKTQSPQVCEIIHKIFG